MEQSAGAACPGSNACARATELGRSRYNYTFTDDRQKKREFEASEAHTIPSRAEALLGVPLTRMAGLGAEDRARGFKCDAP
ncbi:MAG: hypothetical protein U0359_39615, partial [Byssovorax sp.]